MAALVAASCAGGDASFIGDAPVVSAGVADPEQGDPETDRDPEPATPGDTEPESSAAGSAGPAEGCTVDVVAVGSAASESECAALVSFYDALGGAGWIESAGWLTDTEPCAWFRVASDSDGVVEISLLSNRLTGPIPPIIGAFPHLETLHMNANALTGEIPPEIGDLGSLTSISMSNNQLFGPLPDEIGNLAELTNLNLFENQFTEIPRSLTQLDELRSLNLAATALEGPIAPWLGEITSLEYLGLNVNSFTRPIPAELASLSEMEYFYLSFNELSGPVPDELLRFADIDGALLKGNQCLTASEEFAEWFSGLDSDWDDRC